nr:transposase [Butyrivibrio sp.]
ITDGAYSGTANAELAASKNVKLVTTDLTGKDVDVVIGAFKFNEAGTEVLSCPAGHSPKSCTYISQSDMCQISFPKAICENCPYKTHCHPKAYKRVCKVKVSKTMRERARMKAQMNSDEFKNIGRLRNGVETVPSILKNVYAVNRLRVHGIIRCKFYFGSKIAALNFRKLFRYRKGLGHYAPNPVFAG